MRVVAIAAAVILGGCSAAGVDDTAALEVSIAPVWTTDAELHAAAQRAAERILAASGLVVPVHGAAPAGEAVELVRSAPDGDATWLGSWQRGDDMIDVDGDCPVDTLDTLVLHEMLHSLGAEHVKQGRGVLSRLILGHMVITTADLESLCSVAACRWMTPEEN